jgi:hypothetical protein
MGSKQILILLDPFHIAFHLAETEIWSGILGLCPY